jgi:hypothetical protein
MTDPLDDEWERATSRAPPRVAKVLEAMRVDLGWLHATWMDVLFGRDPDEAHSVVEPQAPQEPRVLAGYRLWAAAGVLFLLVAYPLFVLGLATRYYARRIDRLTAGLGFAGVAGLSVLVWGGLTAVTYLSPVAFEGLVAVGTAGVVATISAMLAMYCARLDGRRTSVLLAYPFGVTALFLPPVVASLYSQTLASVVFPRSESLAIWLLNNVLSVGGIAAFIRASFELEGLAYVGMWFLLAVPTGWALGTLVAIVNEVRAPARSNHAEDIDARFGSR